VYDKGLVLPSRLMSVQHSSTCCDAMIVGGRMPTSRLNREPIHSNKTPSQTMMRVSQSFQICQPEVPVRDPRLTIPIPNLVSNSM
jgi:hypothetical protein